ncbi:MAG: LapA family protein [Candidatus Saganbacteria bacterium]|nr:LapA family protein [Candidatus Saganbacteria bacterium]
MWALIVGILIAILIATFASLNSTSVSVNLLFWKAPEISLALVVLFSVLGGVIIAGLFGLPQYLKTKKRIKELESQSGSLEKEAKHETTQEQGLAQD